jgi:enoyl-CoA hydratase/carnithine racemase
VLKGIPAAVVAELFNLGAPLSAERAHAPGVINSLVEPAEVETAALAAALRAATFARLAQHGNVRATAGCSSTAP